MKNFLFLSFCLMLLFSCSKNNKKGSNINSKNSMMCNCSFDSLSYLGLENESFDIHSNSEIMELISSNLVSSGVNSLGYTISDNAIRIFTAEDSTVNSYSIDLECDFNCDTTYENFKLLIVNLDKQHKVYSIMIMKYREVESESYIFEMVDLNGNMVFSSQLPVVGEGLKWKDCFTACWAHLTNDLTGVLACASCPPCCISACTIHCTIYSKRSNSILTDIDFNAWLNDISYQIDTISINGYKIIE